MISQRQYSFHWPAGETVHSDTPVGVSIQLPQGHCRELPPLWCAEGPTGERLLLQGCTLGHWNDGSCRWAILEGLAPAGTPLSGDWGVTQLPNDWDVGRKAIQVKTVPGGFTLSSDTTAVELLATGNWHVHVQGTSIAECSLPVLHDANGKVCVANVEPPILTKHGPLVASIRIVATYRSIGLCLYCDWTFFEGLITARGEVTLHNPQRAKHSGGLWDLGDKGSVLFLSFDVPIRFTEPCKMRLALGDRISDWHSTIELRQESSGGDNWQSKAHLNRHGIVPLSNQGFRGKLDDHPISGLRADPLVQASTPAGVVSVNVDDFWQQFPKSMTGRLGTVTLGLFPRQENDLHELQGGEQKTHILSFTYCLPELPALESPEVTARLLPVNDDVLALPGLPATKGGDATVIQRLDALCDEFLNGPNNVFVTRERVDQYGWRHYGDLHADHEEQFYTGERPLISHYNNQFDVLCGMLLQYARTGKGSWLELARPLASHVFDIDIYNTTQDRAAYSGGLFWFTDHYLHAHTSTHRTYSRRNRPTNGVYGGGPASSHNFTTGLLLYHLLTGCTRAKSGLLRLADWVLRMEDGSATVFGAIDDGPTGLATASTGGLCQAPNRAGGNSLNALLDAWLLTSRRKYLEFAESLIRRVIHPEDDISSMNLLDMEKSWSYTVFLSSLARYLHCKSESAEFDDTYALAYRSLAHYGRWMLEHERPYFDRREDMEYPTEAWAAQEMRKANVLRYAACCVEEPLMQRMQQKGDALAERAWADLMSFTTRTSARAMAVMMIEGLHDAQLRSRGPSAWPPPDSYKFADKEHFMPQKMRVIKRLRSPRSAFFSACKLFRPVRFRRLFNPL